MSLPLAREAKQSPTEGNAQILPPVSRMFFLRKRMAEVNVPRPKHDLRREIYAQELSFEDCIRQFSAHWHHALTLLTDMTSAKKDAKPRFDKLMLLAILSEMDRNRSATVKPMFTWVPEIDFRPYLKYDTAIDDVISSIDIKRANQLSEEFNELINRGLRADHGPEHQAVMHLASCFWLSHYFINQKTGIQQDIYLNSDLRYAILVLLINYYHFILYNKVILKSIDDVIYDFYKDIRDGFPAEIRTDAARQQFLSKVSIAFGSAVDQNKLPEQAPELYKDRDNRKEKPDAFIRRVYARWLSIPGGLPRPILRELDEPLYRAIYKRGVPPDFETLLPTAQGKAVEHIARSDTELLEARRISRRNADRQRREKATPK